MSGVVVTVIHVWKACPHLKTQNQNSNTNKFITGPILGVSTSRKDYVPSYFQANKKDYGVYASYPHAEDFKKKCSRKNSS